MKSKKVKKMIMCAVFVAISALLSQVVLPIGAVPINFALIGVFVASGVLDTKGAVITQAVYIALGIVGVPVFAGFQAGLGTVLGPTGGFIMGYILTALSVSVLIKFIKPIPAMLVGLLLCYISGCAWFVISQKVTLLSALYVIVVPFVIPDIIKVVISHFIIAKIKKSGIEI